MQNQISAGSVERRAVISVSDKTGVTEFAAGLREILPDIRIISTGNTARTLDQAGIAVTPIEDITGFPEILEGRVKTLHPVIHGGILADLQNPGHLEDLQRHDISPVDIVVVNLYPFQKTVAQKGVTRAEAVENIDIGGVTLIRAAAKNADRVIVICDPADYQLVLEELRAKHGMLSFDTRVRLAIKAFDVTSQYDTAIANYLDRPEGEKFARHLRIVTGESVEFRYGENPHQKGVLYPVETTDPLAWYRFEVVQGKAMSYNNWLDLSAACDAISYIGGERPASIVVKHTNPCGGAHAESIQEALENAWAGDDGSIWRIVAVNRPIDESLAVQMVKGNLWKLSLPRQTLKREILAKKTDLRVLINSALMNPMPSTDLSMKQIRGGMLVQEPDIVEVTAEDLEVLTDVAPTAKQVEDLLLHGKCVELPNQTLLL